MMVPHSILNGKGKTLSPRSLTSFTQPQILRKRGATPQAQVDLLSMKGQQEAAAGKNSITSPTSELVGLNNIFKQTMSLETVDINP